LLPSSETAIEDWVLIEVPFSLDLTALLTSELQFHCGEPPPAADPKTRIFISNFFLPLEQLALRGVCLTKITSQRKHKS